MGFTSWREFYASDVQGLWGLWLVPAVFLVVLLIDRRRFRGAHDPSSRFIASYALIFTLETLLDPFAGGPLVRWLGLADGWGATIVVFLFVLLGDFRVFVLLFGLIALHGGRPVASALGEAAAWTFVVPIVTVVVHTSLSWTMGPLPSQALWLIYELGFLAMAFLLRERIVPERLPAHVDSPRGYLRAVLAYVAVYYALWAAADVLILTTGADAAWALRVVPNQLYYGLWVPFVYALWLARSSDAKRRPNTRRSTLRAAQ